MSYIAQRHHIDSILQSFQAKCTIADLMKILHWLQVYYYIYVENASVSSLLGQE